LIKNNSRRKDSSFQYDQEMQIVCSNLLRDNVEQTFFYYWFSVIFEFR